MKTICIIGSYDTKHQEMKFMRDRIEAQDVKALLLDASTGPSGYGTPEEVDATRFQIMSAFGIEWDTIADKQKGEKISLMTDAVSAYVLRLYKEGRIDGILAIGGLQNTVMATTAMQKLPIGFPKVMATTVASGTRMFQDVVGSRDIVVIPSISDFTGLNILTSQIIKNACACCVGMVKTAGQTLKKSDRKVIGVSLMGVTNHGAEGAIRELEASGYEVIGFHTTGVGGAIMEEMAADGLIDGILDFTLHELSSLHFKGGFSYAQGNAVRLTQACKKHVPMVICPGGLDFVDYDIREFTDRVDQRKIYMHNRTIAHIKLMPDEAEEVAKLTAERLAAFDYPVKLLIPTDGMRHNAQQGGELYDPEIDKILSDALTGTGNPNISSLTIEGCLDTEEWGRKAAQEMIRTMEQQS